MTSSTMAGHLTGMWSKTQTNLATNVGLPRWVMPLEVSYTRIERFNSGVHPGAPALRPPAPFAGSPESLSRGAARSWPELSGNSLTLPTYRRTCGASSLGALQTFNLDFSLQSVSRGFLNRLPCFAGIVLSDVRSYRLLSSSGAARATHPISTHFGNALSGRAYSMDTTTLLIIVVVVLLLGGGGFYWGRRR